MAWYHFMLDLHECAGERLEDRELLLKAFRDLAEMMEMRIIGGPLVVHYVGEEGSPSGQGLSGFVIVAESHISIHTDTLTNYVSVDVYSCKRFDPEKVEEYLVKLFKASRVERRFLVRGPKREEAWASSMLHR